MVEKIRHIKNPLTIIAIFATLIEIGGTGVLPFIDPSCQKIYIWFLILFPVLLVILFFVTLNFNHKVLYAPSDYKDENIFLKLFDNPTSKEQQIKFKQEIEDVAKTIEEARHNSASDSKFKDLATLYKERLAAEKLAITKLSKDLQLDIKQGVKFKLGKLNFFDGVAIKGNEFHIIEIKSMQNSERNFYHPSFLRFLEKLDGFSKHFSAKGDIVILHLVAIVIEPNADILKIKEAVQKVIQKCLPKRSYSIQLHVWRMDELEKELIVPRQ